MLNTIKTVLAFILVVCLFLPLSSCQYQVQDRHSAEPQVKTEYYYAIPDKANYDTALRFVPAIVFSLPFILSLIALLRGKITVKENLSGIVLSSTIASYIMIYHYFTALELAGYLALAASFAYLLLSVIGTIIGVRLLLESRRDHHSL